MKKRGGPCERFNSIQENESHVIYRNRGEVKDSPRPVLFLHVLLLQDDEQTLSFQILPQNFNRFEQLQFEFVLFSTSGGGSSFRILLSSLALERDLVTRFDRESVVGREVGSVDRQIDNVAVSFVSAVAQ